ncbi:MAG TPA: NAD(P)/FAD-dependent oxidoreductase [Candidatus Polarisedimenticolia bacterium]
MQDSFVDVAIVGAGPAGSAAALALRRAGYSVALLEKARFPRDKICGDFLTPGSVGLLKEIGGGEVETEAPCTLRGMRMTYEGHEILSEFPGARHGWSLSRRKLDFVLARRAVAAGADLIEEFRATEFGSDPETGGRWVEGSYPDGARRRFRARLLLEAGGRHGLIGRRLGWRVDDTRLIRYALWSNMEGVRGLGERGEMHVFADGYVGVAALDRSAGLANVTMALTPGRMARARGHVRESFLDLLARHPVMGPRCRNARLVTSVRGMGPLACRARRLAADRIAMLGDAGGFVDPFTGEGVFVALSGARMLARAVAREGLESAAALASYEREFHSAFGSKFQLCRLLQVVIARPWLARRVARALASRKDLADRMVGTTGDLLPPSSVLNPSYLGRLLIAGMTG